MGNNATRAADLFSIVVTVAASVVLFMMLKGVPTLKTGTIGKILVVGLVIGTPALSSRTGDGG